MLQAVARALPPEEPPEPPGDGGGGPAAAFGRGVDTRLHDAAYAGKTAQVENLLLELGGGNSLLERRDRAGDTALHLACLGGHLRLAARLIEECPRLVDAQDNQGWTALHYAASTGNTGVAEMLLDAGARIVQDKDGNSPAHEAASKGRAACGQLIVERAAAKAASGRAAGRDADLTAVVSAPNAFGETALMLAASRGIPPMCVALVEHGASMEQRNHSGWCALHHAANAGRPAVVALLAQRGANVDAHDKQGETALHKACTKDSQFCVRNLCDAGADVRLLSADGRSPLHCCVANKKASCALQLLGAAATAGVVRYIVVARDRRGRTALDLAVRAANKPIAILLKETVAAMIVQESFRRYLAAWEAKREECAIKIQRVFRGRQGRKFYKKHRSARDIRLNHAARLIQRHYRQWVATRKRRDTYGMAAKFDTGFPTEVVEREAAAHNSAAAKRERELGRERRVVEREQRQQEAVRKEAQALLDANEAAKAKMLAEVEAEQLALQEEAEADQAEELADAAGSKPPPMDMVVKEAEAVQAEEAEEEEKEAEEPPPSRARGPNWDAMGGPEGVIGGPLPPTIDVGAALDALLALEKSTVARFDKLTSAVGMMASRVDSLEKRLLEEMEHDAIHLAQGQDRRADQGFFDNLRSMAGAVSHLRTEQRHADAAAHARKLMSPDEAGIKKAEAKANWGALRQGTTAASVLQAGMGAEFSPQVGGEGTPRSQGSGHSGSRRGSYPLAAREGSSDEITASDLAALALEATESKSKACTLQ